MYAVTGITGKVGAAVARALLARGRPVRAVARNEFKARAWADRGCEIAIAEMTDAAALTLAFQETDGVFVLIPPVFDPEPGHAQGLYILAALTRALEAAGPPKIVCLSTIGAQVVRPNLLLTLGIMERQFSLLSMPAAFVRAAWFMENFAADVATASARGFILSYLQPLDQAFPMVAVADVGHWAADLLQQPWHGQRVVELEGPRRSTPREVAAAFAKALGRSVTPAAVPRELWREKFLEQGAKNPLPRMQMLDGFNAGWIEFERGEAGSVKGVTDLDAVIEGLVRAWRF